MKKWNAPEVAELNINETANGKYGFVHECQYHDCICDNEADHTICGPHEFNCNHKDETETPDELS